jgi:hypothetical protein
MNIELPPARLCSFCRAPADFQILPEGEFFTGSSHPLLACTECRGFITAGDREGLLIQARSFLKPDATIEIVEAVAQMRSAQETFWAAFSGLRHAGKILRFEPLPRPDAKRRRCSFCSAPSEFRLESASGIYSTALYACRTCKKLVIDGAKSALLERANSLISPNASETERLAGIETMRKAQKNFWDTLTRAKSVTAPLDDAPTFTPIGMRCDFCDDPNVVEVLDSPDFLMATDRHGELHSSHGWAVCGPCRTFVNIPDAVKLLERSLQNLYSSPSDPSIQLTKKQQEQLIRDLHLSFWTAKRDEAAGKINEIASKTQELFNRALPRPAEPKNPTAPWLDAIDGQYEALRMLDLCIKHTPHFDAGIQTSWKNDAAALRVAEAYSFSGNALAAINEATKSVPLDCVLATEQIPGTGQGWWWFDPPLSVKTTSNDAGVAAILWSYVQPAKRSSYPAGTELLEIFDDLQKGFLTFSVYTRLTSGELSPSTMWRWCAHETISDVLTRTALEYNQTYPSGEQLRGAKENALLGLSHTLGIVQELSSFFLAAASWLENDIIDKVAGHVERHHAKRLQREHKLKERPARVHIIALRKRHIVHEDDGTPSIDSIDLPPGEAPSKREFQCNWVVDRHWRKQAYGPGRTQRKLIVIEAYPKGPSDKPFKAKAKRVYAVIR